MNATNPATQTPEYQALADACLRMVDAFCNNSTAGQRAAAAKVLDLLGEREIPHDELLDTFRITKNDGRDAGSRWVKGSIARHAFEALVFPEHAESESFELNDSRISKFWLKDQLTGAVVCEFDRGWSIEPTTPAATRITDLLAAGLAETVFGK